MLSFILWFCALICWVWWVIEASKWMIVMVSKYHPSKHILCHMYPSRQQTNMEGGSFLMYSQLLNIIPCYRTGYGQVFRFLCALLPIRMSKFPTEIGMLALLWQPRTWEMLWQNNFGQIIRLLKVFLNL